MMSVVARVVCVCDENARLRGTVLVQRENGTAFNCEPNKRV
jgi:hypothetical protein